MGTEDDMKFSGTFYHKEGESVEAAEEVLPANLCPPEETSEFRWKRKK